MLKVSNAKEMLDIDRTTINKYGIAGIVLMERAGLSVVKRIHEIMPQTPEKTIVLCGGGNNGGDGFVIARILHNQGRDVTVYMTSNPGRMKGDAKANYQAAKKFGVRIAQIQRFFTDYGPRTPDNVLVIDALLGTGLSKNVKSPLSDVISKVNEMNLPVLAVDLPSGVSSDTGEIMGCAIKAGQPLSGPPSTAAEA